MKKRVLVTEALEPKGTDLLHEHFDVVLRDMTTEQELIDLVADFDGLMIKTYTVVSPSVLDVAKKLKVVARAGTGLDKVDLEYAEKKGVLVRNTPEANVVSVAELVFGMMLSIARRIPRADAYVRSMAGWDRDRFTGVELAGRNLGIVGFGNIGKKVAARAAAFEMTVQCYDPFIDSEDMARFGVMKAADLNDLLDSADFITLHIPLVDATHHLFSHTQFKRMKSTAVLVNTARGPVVDEAALIKALQDGEIAGAGLDVFENEPPADPALLALPNLVVTPHVGAATQQALEKMAVQAAHILIEHLA